MRVALVLVLALSSPALAEPSPKSANTALLLTAAGTALPGVVMLVGAQLTDNTEPLLVAGAVGLAILPATGQWYAGRVGTVGLGVRTVGAVALISGFHVLIESEANDDRAAIIMIGGLAAIVGGVVYDYVTVGSAVREWNARHGVQTSVIKVRDGYGLGVTAAF